MEGSHALRDAAGIERRSDVRPTGRTARRCPARAECRRGEGRGRFPPPAPSRKLHVGSIRLVSCTSFSSREKGIFGHPNSIFILIFVVDFLKSFVLESNKTQLGSAA